MKKLSKKEVVSLVDEGCKLDTESKIMEKRLKEIKSLLCSQEVAEIVGKTGVVKITSMTSTNVETAILESLLRDLGREDEMGSLCRVNITEAKKRLGTMHFDSIAKTETKAFAKVSFKINK